MGEYDLIIIGGGPAGLTAAIYAARYKINLLVLTREVGGLAATAHKICNFPSYETISGFDLMQKILVQTQKLGVPIEYKDVKSITKNGERFKISTHNGDYIAKKVIFTGGTEHLQLGIKGEAVYLGKGVSYCATCDAAFFKNKQVAVIGGSDAALTAALLLSEYCNKVYIIYRQDKFFRAEPSWIELVEKEKKIETLFNEELIEIGGSSKLELLKLKSGKDLQVDGVFIEIGSKPHLEMLDSLNITKDKNYIVVNQKQQTNVEGFYAAGDVTNNELKQIVTAAAQGAVASFNIFQELRRERPA